MQLRHGVRNAIRKFYRMLRVNLLDIGAPLRAVDTFQVLDLSRLDFLCRITFLEEGCLQNPVLQNTVRTFHLPGIKASMSIVERIIDYLVREQQHRCCERL